MSKSYPLTPSLPYQSSPKSSVPTLYKFNPEHIIFLLIQFEDLVLECCCFALTNIGNLPPVHRSDPVRVVRHISAIVNSVDDKGIVEGNWTEDFKGGKAPTSWLGSPLILQHYYRTRKPVKYGQCWIFAGVTTTSES